MGFEGAKSSPPTSAAKTEAPAKAKSIKIHTSGEGKTEAKIGFDEGATVRVSDIKFDAVDGTRLFEGAKSSPPTSAAKTEAPAKAKSIKINTFGEGKTEAKIGFDEEATVRVSDIKFDAVDGTRLFEGAKSSPPTSAAKTEAPAKAKSISFLGCTLMLGFAVGMVIKRKWMK